MDEDHKLDLLKNVFTQSAADHVDHNTDTLVIACSTLNKDIPEKK